MKDINGIPCYRATVDGDDTGMVVVSLVDAPAVEVDFLAFDKQQPLQFNIQDEEQRMVLGVVMRPNYPMYRRDESGWEYFVEYAPETIHKMAERFFATMNVNSVDTDHSFELVDGVTLVQAFFKNVEKGINPAGFEDLPDDTLFFQYHITNDEIWGGVKAGTWKGFSLAGSFNIVPIQMQINKKSNTVTMSKLNAIRTLLQKALMAFERISTDKALIEFDGEEIEVGIAVHGVDEEGNPFNLEDGEYKAEDGTVYVIADGKVEEIREPEKNEEPEAPAEPESEGDQVPSGVTAEEEAPAAEAEPEDDRIANLEAEIARLEEELGAARERIAELERENEELKNKPAAEPAAAEFEKVNKVEKTGNRKLDNLTRILNA